MIKEDSWFRSLDIIAINIQSGSWCRVAVPETNVKLSSFSLSPSGHWIAFSGHKNNYTVEIHGTMTKLGVVSSDGKTNRSIMDSIPSGYAFPIVLWKP